MKLLPLLLLPALGCGHAAEAWKVPNLQTSHPDALYYKVDASWNSPAAVLAKPDVGGLLFIAAANPYLINGFLEPGPKVVFWGQGTGCPLTAGGLAAAPAGVAWRKALQAAGTTESNTLALMRWTPAANNMAGCVTPGLSGASASFIANPPERVGWYLYTASGKDSDGSPVFWEAYSEGGQGGSGANAYIQGTFVNFRQAYWDAAARKPFRAYGRARISGVRYINAQETGPVIGSGPTLVTQAKQQMQATFINQSCMLMLAPPGPCQIQYLFNTALFRSDTSDWRHADWHRNANLAFDPEQGGIPVVMSSVPAIGRRMLDASYQLPLFVSQGAASQMSWGEPKLAPQTVDVAIEWAEFVNALKLVVGAKNGKPPGEVAGAELAAYWGAAWNDRSQWSTLEVAAAQEVYNPRRSNTRVEIAGYWNQLYVGPQDRAMVATP